MLTSLPPEILLNILSFLDVYDLRSSQLLSKYFYAFFKENESIIYRNAAIFHAFVSAHDTSPIDAQKTYPGRWLQGLSGWKDLCQRFFQLENNWEARGEPPEVRSYSQTGPDVHRFKLDEREGNRFIISTHRRGGLRVNCMDTDTTLFELEDEYVRIYAHCEYDNGYLVFDRFLPHALEVWRLESDDWDGVTVPSVYKPDNLMYEAASQAQSTSQPYPRRGHFAPWALFIPPQHPRAYRLVYPTLLVGSERGQEMYLFDLPSASLTQTIPLPQDVGTQPTNVHLKYVEIGARHAFVCTPSDVLILPRNWSHEPDARNVYLRFPGDDPELRNPQLNRHYATRLVPINPVSPTTHSMKKYMVTAPRLPEQSLALISLGEVQQEFSAVHVSPSGKDFAAATIFGILYIVRDFERIFRDNVSFSDITLRINLGCSALNLAYEFDRVVVQTVRGIFIFSLHSEDHPPFDVIKPYGFQSPNNDVRGANQNYIQPTPVVYPNINASELVFFRNSLPLRLLSCLKLTKTGIWIDWSIRALEEIASEDGTDDEGFMINDFEIDEVHPYANRMVCHISFSPHVLHAVSSSQSSDDE